MTEADLLGLTLEDATRLLEMNGSTFSICSTGTSEGASAVSLRVVRAAVRQDQWLLTVCSVPDPYG
jgi:hypothetical protein